MAIKYIYDSHGKKTGVIIPIKMWNENKSLLKDQLEEKNEKVFKPSKYWGIYHNLKLDLEKEVKDLRDEWVRI